MEPGTITVRGTASAPGRPDDMRISLTVSAVARSPEGALDDAKIRVDRLHAVLDAADIPPGNRTTSAINIAAVREGDGTRQLQRSDGDHRSSSDVSDSRQ